MAALIALAAVATLPLLGCLATGCPIGGAAAMTGHGCCAAPARQAAVLTCRCAPDGGAPPVAPAPSGVTLAAAQSPAATGARDAGPSAGPSTLYSPSTSPLLAAPDGLYTRLSTFLI